MKSYSIKIDPLTNEEYLEVEFRGQQLLTDPFLNKGSAFTEEERLRLGLAGLLRSSISDIETQSVRSYEMYTRKHDEIEKYIFLQSLLNRNETLFYHLLSKHLIEMLPIVYTPTVGKACLMLSRITREYRGIYISPANIANIDEIFQDVSLPEVSLIVATESEFLAWGIWGRTVWEFQSARSICMLLPADSIRHVASLSASTSAQTPRAFSMIRCTSVIVRKGSGEKSMMTSSSGSCWA
jgi:hypothetical protein